jgi:HK97 gp10 family phage protein
MADGIEVKLYGVDNVLNLLRQLPAEVASKKGGLALAALRKGARVILREERKNLDRVTSNATTTGEQESTGLLKKSLSITRGKAPSVGNGERVVIRVRKKTYPGRQNARRETTTIQTAQMLEYGTSRQPAEPWIRPAFKAKAEESIRTVEKELAASVEQAARKYLR